MQPILIPPIPIGRQQAAPILPRPRARGRGRARQQRRGVLESKLDLSFISIKLLGKNNKLNINNKSK